MWRRTCWNKVKRWSVETKTRPKLQVNTDPREGVDLNTGFPEVLALLRHVGIKETDSGEFFLKAR